MIKTPCLAKNSRTCNPPAPLARIRLMKQLMAVLASAKLTAPESYVYLRNFLARTWLEKMHLPADLIELDAGPLPPALLRTLQQGVAEVDAGPESSKAVLTPEIIGLANEMCSARASDGVFYTPFDTATQLARETLLAWLKNHRLLPADARTLNAADIPAACRARAEEELARLTVCDPACGAGGLLVAFWLELADLRHALSPHQSRAQLLADIAAHLYAADINPRATADFRLRLSLTLAAYGQPLPDRLPVFTLDALCGNPHPVWQAKCPEVFARGGFDIYLSNPPYLGQKNHKEIFSSLRQNPRWTPWINAKGDLLYLFFHLAFELINPGGVAGLLTTSYFAQAAAARPLRERLQQDADVWRLIDFGEEKLFRRAKGQHNLITVFSRRANARPACVCGAAGNSACKQEELFFGPSLFLQTCPPKRALTAALIKMAAAPKRLRQMAHISNGLMTGCDRAFIVSYAEKDALTLTSAEQQKLKPFFKNSDIAAYTAARTPRYYLIDFFYPNDKETDFSHYPHLRAHLSIFKDKLLARKQNNNGIDKQLAQGKYWFGSVRRKINFEAEKIVVPHRARTNTFAYAPHAWYASSDVYFISAPRSPLTLWYLLAVLNSAPYYAWLYYKGKRKGSLLELYSEPLGEIPIPAAPVPVQKKLEDLARQIYALKQKNPSADIRSLQAQINRQVCALFQFSEEETHAVSALAAT